MGEVYLEFCSLLIDEIVRFIKFVYNTLNACLVIKVLAIGQYNGFCNPSKCSALKERELALPKNTNKTSIPL